MLITLSIILGITGLLLVVRHLFYSYQQKKIISSWRNHWGIGDKLPILNSLYVNCDGYHYSYLGRQLMPMDLADTYGEICFESFIALISLTAPDEQTIFYDLGSGTGKAVITVALIFNVKKCVGIEHNPHLHQAAIQQKQAFLEKIIHIPISTEIAFIEANFLKQCLWDATHIFIQGTAFIGDVWDSITYHLTQVEKNTVIITTSKKLHHDTFILIRETMCEMSFGVIQAYIYQKI